jgi:hypothetical protein
MPKAIDEWLKRCSRSCSRSASPEAEHEVSRSSRRFKKAFLWTLGVFVVLITALIVLSIWSPDRPFLYVLQ